jgi:hypothetical protein
MGIVLLGGFVAVLAVFLVGLLWAGAARRKGQQPGLPSEETPNGQDVDGLPNRGPKDRQG